MYSNLFIFNQFFSLICAEMLCNIHRTWDSNKVDLATIYTVANYQFPKSRGKVIEANVSCPCNKERNFCLRKCCLPDEASTVDKQCNSSNLTEELKPTKFKKVMNVTKASNTWMVYGIYCSNVMDIDKIDLSLPIPLETDYCIDYFSDAKTYLMAKCVTSYPVKSVPIKFTIPTAISIVFLVITFLVYISFQSLRNLPGKILLAYVLSLLVTYTLYVMLQVTMIHEGTLCICSGTIHLINMYLPISYTYLSNLLAPVLAYVLQFSFSATFFWLNVMCFDLWWTFSGNRAFNGLSRDKGGKRFYIYCLYAWGCPALISIATFIIDSTDYVSQDMKPNLGRNKRCWLGNDGVAVFLYFYSFISILLCANFIMFLHTTVIIINHNKNQVKYLEGNGNRRHLLDKEKKRFYVYLKLFSMMGINWLLEILSYFYQERTPSIAWVWNIIDIYNLLQGTFIFIVFVCKRRVLILLNKKIFPKRIMIKDNLRSSSFTNNTVSSVLHKENSKSSLKIEMLNVRSVKCKQINKEICNGMK